MPLGDEDMTAGLPLTPLERMLDTITLLEMPGDGLIGASPDERIVSWSAGAKAIFGYTRDEVIGRPTTMLSPPGRSDQASAFFARARGGETVPPTEVKRVHKDGRELTLRLSVTPVHGENGDVMAVVAALRDITAERGAYEELRESEERYRAVVESLSEGIIVADRDGRVVAFNSNAVHMAGMTPNTLSEARPEQPGVELIREDGSPLPSEETPIMLSLSTGQPHAGVVLGARAPDGSVRWLVANSAPLRRSGETEPYAAAGSFMDITRYRKAVSDLAADRVEDLKRLALVCEYRDDSTSRHTERVGRTAGLLAAQLKLDGEMVRAIGRAAPLHDVGKVGIPDSILLKPGALTAEERTTMQTHITIGARILGASDFAVLRLAMEIALTHHERWDGGGYPNGLRGEDIPVSGRIVAVADAFDAMTHERAYRRPVSASEALAEIERCSGAHFDPAVVAAFLALDHDSLMDDE
ncbi:MAG: HD domain-containing phosphohydrolase [Solirubrobacteraceae bacterium]